jgi:class 3 adenylate cyclase/predicted ATPase
MFADLCGSTQLSEELDPEDMRDLVLAYQTASTAAIGEHNGFIARYTGDGILAYFGYPEAHEDDARRAVAAGLALIEAVSALSEEFDRDDMAVRVGLHTGEVVVADMGVSERRQERDVVGETPNVAARLQAAADRNCVVISDRTRSLVEGWFNLTELGDLTLAGVSRPVPAYRVGCATGARTRIDAVGSRGLTPMVGREREMRALVEDWASVAAGGGGRVALLSGEPGIGKSRLAHELLEHAHASDAQAIRLRCSPYHGSSALFPVVEHLQRTYGADGESDPADRLDRLEQDLGRAGLPVASTAPLFAELVGIPADNRYGPSTDSPDRRKRRTLGALFQWLVAQGQGGPLLIVIEDVHWIDPTTQELLARWFGPDPVDGVMLVVTYRAEFAPVWVDRAHVRRLTLERLRPEHVHEIVDSLAHGMQLPTALERQISARTDGVPLFVEEVTQAVLESGAVVERAGRLVATATLPDRLVPSTLRESLVARLDGLGPAREVAQVLSVVGREVTADFLQSASLLDYDELEAGLERLAAADLVKRRESPAGATYGLKHWLVQDVAYESLLRSRRRSYHKRIAEAISRDLREVADSHPEFVAHHLIAAGQETEAIGYLQRAGEMAHRRSASAEAVEHLSRALELLRGQPATRARDQLELRLLILLGAPLTASKGYSVPEVEQTYTRAGEICRSLGDDSPDFFRALYGTWRVHLLRADYDVALGFARQLMELAERSANETQLAAARRAMGSTLLYLGDDPRAAHGQLQKVIDSAALERTRLTFIDELHDITDPWITCHAYQAWQLWLLGHPGEARAMSDRAIDLAAQLQHPFTRTLSLAFDSWLCQWLGDVEGCRTRARDALTLATDQGFAFWIGWAEMMEGWADSRLGDPEGGLVTMQRGLEAWRAVGSELGVSFFLTLMADAQMAAGRFVDARGSLDAADAVAKRTHEGWWAPEVARLHGELVVRRGDDAPELAELHMRRGLDLARSRGSEALARRASDSLAALGVEV